MNQGIEVEVKDKSFESQSFIQLLLLLIPWPPAGVCWRVGGSSIEITYSVSPKLIRFVPCLLLTRGVSCLHPIVCDRIALIIGSDIGQRYRCQLSAMLHNVIIMVRKILFTEFFFVYQISYQYWQIFVIQL